MYVSTNHQAKPAGLALTKVFIVPERLDSTCPFEAALQVHIRLPGLGSTRIDVLTHSHLCIIHHPRSTTPIAFSLSCLSSPHFHGNPAFINPPFCPPIEGIQPFFFFLEIRHPRDPIPVDPGTVRIADQLSVYPTILQYT